MIRAGQIALGLLGALALVFLCLLGFAAHWKSGRAALLARGSHIAQTTVGPIEYRVFGEGPAVLVLHGMMGGYDQGLLIAKAVGKPNFQFIAVSRPGYLRTPLRSGRTFEEQADGYVALLDALKIEKAGVIAYSAGGHSAVPLVLRHPERCWGLVLLSGHTRPMGEVPSKASTKQAILTYVVKSDLFSLTMHSALQKIPLCCGDNF